MSTYGNNITLKQVPLNHVKTMSGYLETYEYTVPADSYLDLTMIMVSGSLPSALAVLLKDASGTTVSTITPSSDLAALKGVKLWGGSKIHATLGVGVSTDLRIYGTLFQNTP